MYCVATKYDVAALFYFLEFSCPWFMILPSISPYMLRYDSGGNNVRIVLFTTLTGICSSSSAYQRLTTKIKRCQYCFFLALPLLSVGSITFHLVLRSFPIAAGISPGTKSMGTQGSFIVLSDSQRSLTAFQLTMMGAMISLA
ncbi:hypothetical protein C8Q79DRAFT_779283 [Trametes meyenii]|nr:hypothetical protein C8Q79DRAFT_779283 [Trametes meyenii]